MPTPTPPASAPANGERTVAGMRIILLRSLLALLVAVGLLALKEAFERTSPGRAMRLAMHGILQDALRGPESGKDLPVTVVDISRLPRVEQSGGGEPVTSRTQLWSVIEQVARHRPAAIGIDIDFGPTGSGWIDDVEDPVFLYQCLELTRVGLPASGDQPAVPPTPVFVGVQRTLAAPPEQWLGSPEFRPLAAAIAVTPEEGMVSLPHSIQRSGDGGTRDEACRAMGVRLADAVRSREQLHVTAYRLFPAAFQQISETDLALAAGNQLRIRGLRAIDFSMVDGFRRAAVAWDSISAAEGRRFEGRAVLLGDADPPAGRDRLTDPAGRRFPGVFAHASVAYTLVRGPLFTLAKQAQIALDLVALIVPLCVAVVLQRWFWKRDGRLRDADRFLSLLGWIYLLGLFSIGVYFVRNTRVLWNDFLVGLPFLFLAPVVERWLGPWLGLRRKSPIELFEIDPLHETESRR